MSNNLSCAQSDIEEVEEIMSEPESDNSVDSDDGNNFYKNLKELKGIEAFYNIWHPYEYKDAVRKIKKESKNQRGFLYVEYSPDSSKRTKEYRNKYIDIDNPSDEVLGILDILLKPALEGKFSYKMEIGYVSTCFGSIGILVEMYDVSPEDVDIIYTSLKPFMEDPLKDNEN